MIAPLGVRGWVRSVRLQSVCGLRRNVVPTVVRHSHQVRLLMFTCMDHLVLEEALMSLPDRIEADLYASDVVQ